MKQSFEDECIVNKYVVDAYGSKIQGIYVFFLVWAIMILALVIASIYTVATTYQDNSLAIRNLVLTSVSIGLSAMMPTLFNLGMKLIIKVHTIHMEENIPCLLLYARKNEANLLQVNLEEFINGSWKIDWKGTLSYKTKTKDKEITHKVTIFQRRKT